MMLVALDHTTAPNMWGPAQHATLIAHDIGAAFWILIAVYAEMYTLYWAKDMKLTKMEKCLRTTCVVLSLVGVVLFIVCTKIPASSLGLCCDDEYRTVTMENVEGARANGAY